MVRHVYFLLETMGEYYNSTNLAIKLTQYMWLRVNYHPHYILWAENKQARADKKGQTMRDKWG